MEIAGASKSFSPEECERAYQSGGKDTKASDYEFDWYKNLPSEEKYDQENYWNEEAFYADFDKWWNDLPFPKKERIYKEIIGKFDRQDLMNQIILAVIRGWDFDDVEMVEYQNFDEKDKYAIMEDRFNYIDISNGNANVWIIAGTGHEDFSVALESLTDASLRELYDTIPAADEDWQPLLTKANEDLRQYGVMLIVDCVDDCFYSLEIRYGLNPKKPNILQYKEKEDYADNYYDNEMEALIKEAWPYAKNKAKSQSSLWVVTHVTLSDTEYEANGHSDVKIFRCYDKAKQQMQDWINEEKQQLEENSRDYEILQDEPTAFRMSWSGGGFNQVRITIRERSIED